jgi:hypothetical protein
LIRVSCSVARQTFPEDRLLLFGGASKQAGALSSETRWRSATLDSADAAGPDDPDLTFTASLEYRSVEAAP